MGYTYLTADLRTNEILEELPLKVDNFGTVLDGIGSFSGVLPLDDVRLRKIDWRAATEPKRTALYVDRDGVLVWGGIIWTRRPENGGHAARIEGNEFESIAAHRRLRSRQGMLFATDGSTEFQPSADVEETNVAGHPDTTDLWRNIDDIGPTDFADFILNTAKLGSWMGRFNVVAGSLDGVTIRSVRLVIVAQALAPEGRIVPRLRIGGNNHDGIDRAISNRIRSVSYTWDENPETGLPWTTTDLENFASSDSAGYVYASSKNKPNLGAYQARMIVTWDAADGGRINFSGVDQFDIVRDFFRHAASSAGGDIGIVLDDSLSGVARDRVYYGYDRKPIYEAIEQLSAVIDGFNFKIDVRYDENQQPAKFLTLSAPRRGRLAADNGLVFELPGNVVSYAWPEDGTRSSNHITAIGAGEGDEMLLAEAVDLGQIDAGYPLLEDVTTYKDIENPATLDAHAQADLEAFGPTVTLPTLTVRADQDPVLGSYIVGDDVRVRITDPYFPRPTTGGPGLSTILRITAIDVNPGGDDSPEQVVLTMGAA